MPCIFWAKEIAEMNKTAIVEINTFFILSERGLLRIKNLLRFIFRYSRVGLLAIIFQYVITKGFVNNLKIVLIGIWNFFDWDLDLV